MTYIHLAEITDGQIIHVKRKYEPSFVLKIYLNYVLNVWMV